MGCGGRLHGNNFYPRSPCGERPARIRRRGADHPISIHALLAESDAAPGRRRSRWQDFYSRSPCGERHGFALGVHGIAAISIHALLAESDSVLQAQDAVLQVISIHALLAESDCHDCHLFPWHFLEFLSTLSLRRATRLQGWSGWNHPISIHALLAESDSRSNQAVPAQHYFYPRSPCGERLLPVARPPTM